MAEYPASFPQRFKAEIEGARIRAIAGLDIDDIRKAFLDGRGELERLGDVGLRITPPYVVDVITKSGSAQKLRITG